MNKLLQIFIQYLSLGLISFGGPATHIGYFHKVFVQEKKWLDDASYARLLSLSQILPGPGSSQMVLAIGLHRGGIIGGFIALLGFTLPSFLLMYFLAVSANSLGDNLWFSGAVEGLKLLAVVVVADATYKLYCKFCTSKAATSIAVLTACFLLISASLINQVMVLMVAAIIGMFIHKPSNEQLSKSADKKFIVQGGKAQVGKISLGLFFLLLIGASFISFQDTWLALFAQFYQAGALVFGGGHVVLPLLQEIIGGQIDPDRFLMGYAAAQAVPGPMFTLASFLGAELSPQNHLMGAFIATVGIFLPGFLLIIALYGAWQRLAQNPKVAGAIWGINAAVVGLLITAFYDPVFTSTISNMEDAKLRVAIALFGFFALQQLKVKIVWLVLAFALIGIVLESSLLTSFT